MSYAFGIATLVACEIALRLRILRSVARARSTLRTALAVMRHPRLSDSRKQRLVVGCSLRLLRQYSACLFKLAFTASPLVVVGFFVEGGFDSFVAEIHRTSTLVWSIGLTCVYVCVRPRIN